MNYHYKHLSHRGLMKMACAQNNLIIKMITIKRFEDSTGDQNESWSKAFRDFDGEVKEIYHDDRNIKL